MLLTPHCIFPLSQASFFLINGNSGRSTTASLKLTALMHSSELLTCAWAWICIWLCELVWCLVGVCRGVNPVTQPLAMFVFKVNESLPPSAARILFSKECPPASVDMGLACHTRLKRPELQSLFWKFIKTRVIFALKMKFCVNSLYFLFRLRKKSMNESLFNMLIQIKHTDNQPSLFPPLQFSTVSSFHHFTCCLHHSAVVKWPHLPERYSESVARCHYLQNLVVWEEG